MSHLAGFIFLRVQTLDKVKKALILVEEELRDSEIFLDFFEFAFKFCLTVSFAFYTYCHLLARILIDLGIQNSCHAVCLTFNLVMNSFDSRLS